MRRILIVDDNLPSRELLKAVLKRSCDQVLEAREGKEALEIISRDQPDLVFLDLQMPVMDGFAVLNHIRQDPQSAGLRVVAVTANAMQGEKERVLAAGFDAYIAKPINAAMLRKQVEQMLGQQLSWST